MPLTQDSAARKDSRNANSAMLEHRHFAFIAATIARLAEADLKPMQVRNVALVFASACARTNPRFDRARFLKACGEES